MITYFGPGTAPTQICLLQQTSTTGYDAAGNVDSTTNALGYVTSYSHDNLGRQTQVTQPAVNGTNPITTTAFDGDGNVTATIDPLGPGIGLDLRSVRRRYRRLQRAG